MTNRKIFVIAMIVAMCLITLSALSDKAEGNTQATNDGVCGENIIAGHRVASTGEQYTVCLKQSEEGVAYSVRD